jgi:hypothetical protein
MGVASHDAIPPFDQSGRVVEARLVAHLEKELGSRDSRPPSLAPIFGAWPSQISAEALAA